MATTTATITLSSADIQSDVLALTKQATLNKANTTTGLDQTIGLNKIIFSGSLNPITLIPETAAGLNKAAKVYIANKSTDASEFVTITIHAQIIGRLYAGDWMFMPWSQIDGNDLKLTTSVATALPVEYMMIHEGITSA